MEDIPSLLISSAERAPWGWSLLLIAIIALIKVWPALQLQADNARAALRGERRDDLHNCNKRLDEMGEKVDAMTHHVHQLDLKLVGTVAAYRILHDHLTDTDPTESALIQARVIFKTTWDGVLPASGPLAMVVK